MTIIILIKLSWLFPNALKSYHQFPTENSSRIQHKAFRTCFDWNWQSFLIIFKIFSDRRFSFLSFSNIQTHDYHFWYRIFEYSFVHNAHFKTAWNTIMAIISKKKNMHQISKDLMTLSRSEIVNWNDVCFFSIKIKFNNVPAMNMFL